MGGEDQTAWAHGWIAAGFDALEPMVARYGAGFAFGETPDHRRLLPDPAGLVVQPLYRRPCALSGDPNAVDARAAAHPAFQSAHPDRQPDAVK